MVMVVMMLVMMDGDGDLMLVMMMIVMMVVIMVVIVMIVGFAPANYEHIHGDERLYPSSVRDQSTSRARAPTIAPL